MHETGIPITTLWSNRSRSCLFLTLLLIVQVCHTLYSVVTKEHAESQRQVLTWKISAWSAGAVFPTSYNHESMPLSLIPHIGPRLTTEPYAICTSHAIRVHAKGDPLLYDICVDDQVPRSTPGWKSAEPSPETANEILLWRCGCYTSYTHFKCSVQVVQYVQHAAK